MIGVKRLRCMEHRRPLCIYIHILRLDRERERGREEWREKGGMNGSKIDRRKQKKRRDAMLAVCGIFISSRMQLKFVLQTNSL